MEQNKEIIGYYSSYETFGAVDGPGVRFVLFLQGCTLRCKYCHNPETIEFNKNKPITVEEVLELYSENESFYSKGGITVSGGEATAQMDFIIELFKEAKKRNINTCVDTAFGTFQNIPVIKEKWKELCKVSDLFLADIKHIDSEKHKVLTSRPNENILEAIKYIDSLGAKMWIRHVLVPGYSDDKQDLINLGKFIKELDNIERLEILPYHNMMIPKYQNLKMKFYLSHVIPPTKEYCGQCKDVIMQGVNLK